MCMCCYTLETVFQVLGRRPGLADLGIFIIWKVLRLVLVCQEPMAAAAAGWYGPFSLLRRQGHLLNAFPMRPCDATGMCLTKTKHVMVWRAARTCCAI